jgi:hypothetical protein
MASLPHIILIMAPKGGDVDASQERKVLVPLRDHGAATTAIAAAMVKRVKASTADDNHIPACACITLTFVVAVQDDASWYNGEVEITASTLATALMTFKPGDDALCDFDAAAKTVKVYW